MLDMLRLEGLQDRLPAQLSGGQQRRVAVGRALVINPVVLLLDEPFSNLDALVRDSTRLEMRRIQQELGLTVIFVTHDQSEAMAIADRVAVMERGRLVQIGTPHEIYEQPNSRFVASFIGRANVIDVDRQDGGNLVRTKAGFDACFENSIGRGQERIGAVVIRPEAISIDAEPANGPNSVRVQVESVSFLGPAALFQLKLPDGTILAAEGPGQLARRFVAGSEVTARWQASSLSRVPD